MLPSCAWTLTCMSMDQPFLVSVGSGSFAYCWTRACITPATSCSRTSQYIRWQSPSSCAYSGRCALASSPCSSPAAK